MMSKHIKIRFEPGSNDEFVGDCVGKYEAYVAKTVGEAFDADVEITEDSPFGVEVVSRGFEGQDDDPRVEDEIREGVEHLLDQAGNNLTEICK